MSRHAESPAEYPATSGCLAGDRGPPDSTAPPSYGGR